jgi:adenylate kinase family enzyme
MSPRVALVLLMGLPGSGKSTLCLRLMQLDQGDANIKHVCYDELLEVNDTEKWRDGRDNIIKNVEELILNYVCIL